MLEEPIQEGVAPKMKGSVLMCVADTEEEVLERVRKDVYWTSDVWDKEKVSEYCSTGLEEHFSGCHEELGSLEGWVVASIR
jgi:hypothetical protein